MQTNQEVLADVYNFYRSGPTTKSITRFSISRHGLPIPKTEIQLNNCLGCNRKLRRVSIEITISNSDIALLKQLIKTQKTP